MTEDWIGIKKSQHFLSGKDFPWFEKKKIKNEENLTEEDKRWLRGWTLAPLGFAFIFYLGSKRRKLYDIFTIYILYYLYFEAVYEKFIQPLLFNDVFSDADPLSKYKINVFIVFAILLLNLVLYVFSLYYAIYFPFRHGKRLSWNRGDWSSIAELKTSEKKWFQYNFLLSMSVAILGILILIFYL